MRRDIHAEDYKSKSQLKREAQARTELGFDLVKLKPSVLAQMPLPEHILDAITAAQNMKQGALKRQLQYIGGLLREEEDLTVLEKALAPYLK